MGFRIVSDRHGEEVRLTQHYNTESDIRIMINYLQVSPP